MSVDSPWIIEEPSSGHVIWIGPEGAQVGTCDPIIAALDIYSLDAEFIAKKRCLAKIIAAAPELLGACKAIADSPCGEPSDDVWRQMHAAIAKAEGRS